VIQVGRKEISLKTGRHLGTPICLAANNFRGVPDAFGGKRLGQSVREVKELLSRLHSLERA